MRRSFYFLCIFAAFSPSAILAESPDIYSKDRLRTKRSEGNIDPSISIASDVKLTPAQPKEAPSMDDDKRRRIKEYIEKMRRESGQATPPKPEADTPRIEDE